MAKEKKQKKQVNLAPLKGIGKAIAVVAEKAAGHPAGLALFLMAGTAVVNTIVLAADPKKEHERTRVVTDQMTGLYGGSQSALQVLAIAPVVVAAAQAVSAFAPVPKP